MPVSVFHLCSSAYYSAFFVIALKLLGGLILCLDRFIIGSQTLSNSIAKIGPNCIERILNVCEHDSYWVNI